MAHEQLNRDKIVRRCEYVMVGAFCALIYFLPISNGLSEWSFGFAFIAFNIKRYILFRHEMNYGVFTKNPSLWTKVKVFLKSFKPVSSYLSWPIGIFVLVAFASIFISHYPGQSIKAFVFKLLQGTYLYFMFIECFTTKKRLRVLIWIFLVSVGIIGANGIFQYSTGEGFIFHHRLSGVQITSTFKHGNDFGSYLIMMSLIIIGMAIFAKVSSRMNNRIFQSNDLSVFRSAGMLFIIFLLAGLLLVNLGLTFSRGAWIGFLCGMFFLGFLNRRTLLLTIPVCVIFLLIFYPMMKNSRDVSFISDQLGMGEVALERDGKTVKSGTGGSGEAAMPGRDESEKSFDQDAAESTRIFSGMGRTGFWQEAIAIIKDYPVLGTGLNTYSLVAPKYKINWGGYAHNCYLQMAAELGIVGLVSFLWIQLALFMKSVRVIPFIKDPVLLAILGGALSGLFGFLMHSGVDTALYSARLFNLMWVIMGLIVATQKVDLGKSL